jgi:hypothetical protein
MSIGGSARYVLGHLLTTLPFGIKLGRMKSPILTILLLAPALAFGQKFQDASVKRSPLSLSIKIDSDDGKPYIHVHSNSPKGVLALVAFITFSYEKGQVAPLTTSQDYAFKLEPLKLGEERDIAPAYLLPEPDAKITEAVGQVLFVQYEDGSTWGNLEAAKRLLGSRPQKLAFLKHLVETYYESGQDAFDAILNDPKLPFEPESIVAGCLKAQAEYQKTTPIDLAKKQLAAAQGWHASGIF